jgi:hypothetical protein
MGTEEAYGKDLPSDPHLKEDVGQPIVDAKPEDTSGRFTPGQTNAGQQVGGLASGTDFGEAGDPDAQPDENNPI